MCYYYEFVFGLSFYVVLMLWFVKLVVDFYLFVNWDLLYVGVILYDLGKVIEFLGFVLMMYILEGNLIGYIFIVVEEVSKIVDEFLIDGEEVVVLKYVFFFYYGKGEWGSLKLLFVCEVEILY